MTRRKQQKKTGKSNKPKKQGRQNTVVHIENTNKKQQEIVQHEAPEEIDAQEQPTGFYSVLVDEEGPQDDANEGTAEEGTTDTVEIAEEPNESDKGWEEIDCDNELEISLRPQTSLAASQCLPQQKPSIQIYDREFLLSFSTVSAHANKTYCKTYAIINRYVPKNYLRCLPSHRFMVTLQPDAQNLRIKRLHLEGHTMNRESENRNTLSQAISMRIGGQSNTLLNPATHLNWIRRMIPLLPTLGHLVAAGQKTTESYSYAKSKGMCRSNRIESVLTLFSILGLSTNSPNKTTTVSLPNYSRP